MRARERAAAQARVMNERPLLDQLCDRPQMPVLEVAQIEMPLRGAVFGPAEKDVARRLHHPLAFDHPLAGMTLEMRSETLEHRASRFLDLQEQRRVVAAHEQA